MNENFKTVATVHTGVLLENKNKRDICINASNFGVQNSAITLIALIITIIVLLILAGVTLNMVMGENGIFGKANNAKNKTEVAKYEEELRMCVLELQTDAATNGTTFNMETIKNKFVEKVKELENTTEIEFPTKKSETRLDGTYKGYEFYIDDKYVAHIGDKATGITLTTSINPSGWTQGPVTATITIKSNNGINNVEPDEGSKNGNEYIITKTDIAENASFKYTVTDGQGNTQTKTAVINTIDTNPPEDFTIAAENTEEGLKITGEATDAESGIDRYEYYVKKSTDDKEKSYTENPIKNLGAGTYSVYVRAYDKAGNYKDSEKQDNIKILGEYKNITAQMVAEHPEIYYGLTVTNYESQNKQKDWKIFYSDWNENPDDAHIFLITGDYVDLSVTDRLNSNTKMKIIEDSKYRAYWDEIPDFQTVDSEVLERFKTTGFRINEYQDKDNSKCVSTLLNIDNWKKYLDKEDGTGKAEYAIGGSTIEMWIDSWNTLYKNVDGKLYIEAGPLGYYTGISIHPTEYIYGQYIKERKGYENKLYYPYTVAINEEEGTVDRYWIASPYSQKKCIYNIHYSGSVVGNQNTNKNIALRPVVSLNKDITVDAIN